jgi:hypothetical protein
MRSRITPSLVLSIIAVVLSLTGVGYAATQLPRDSVGSAQIKAGAVGSVEVADGSLRPVDFSDAAKDALEGKRGAKGAKGDAGPAGPAGPAGASGSGSDVTVTDANGVVVGTLQSIGNDYNVWVRTANGLLAYYDQYGHLRSAGAVVSLNADCSPPLYVNSRNAPPIGVPVAPFPGTSAYVTSNAAPISPDPSSLVYPISTECTGASADLWDSSPSFIRMDPVSDVPLSVALPLTFG